MTSSSAHADHPARFGRLQQTSAWCANPAMLEDPVVAKSQYLQIDFLNLKRIAAVRTQGLGFSSVVTKYYLYYATDADAFHSYRQGEKNEIVVSTFYVLWVD